jgi:hypothetical protein
LETDERQSSLAAPTTLAACTVLEARVAACCYETSGRDAAVRTPLPSGHAGFSFLTPNPTTSPAHEPRAHSPRSSSRAQSEALGDEAALCARWPSPTRARAACDLRAHETSDLSGGLDHAADALLQTLNLSGELGDLRVKQRLSALRKEA